MERCALGEHEGSAAGRESTNGRHDGVRVADVRLLWERSGSFAGFSSSWSVGAMAVSMK